MTARNNNIDLDKICLPKWPCLLVVGDNVTTEQAKQIIVRTDQWRLDWNNIEWNITWQDALMLQGLKYEIRSTHGYLSQDYARRFLPELNQERGCIPLDYLDNSLISWSTESPFSWCDWSGRIQSSMRSIGKWPSARDVMQEWVAIARAFPFLSLTSQLLSGESRDIDAHPVIEYRVRDGEVSAHLPEELICKPEIFKFDERWSAPHSDAYRVMVLDAIGTVFAQRESKEIAT